MKLAAILCVSLFAVLGACDKKKVPTNGTPPRPENSAQPADLELEKRVRQSILDDAVLSARITGLQIAANNSGGITLRGSVKTQKDKDAVGAKARGVAGVTNILNELTVTG
jgi:osmotically-inducible protein OsmY